MFFVTCNCLPNRFPSQTLSLFHSQNSYLQVLHALWESEIFLGIRVESFCVAFPLSSISVFVSSASPVEVIEEIISHWTPRNDVITSFLGVQCEINLRVFNQGNKLVGPQDGSLPAVCLCDCSHLLSVSPWSLPRSLLSESHICSVSFSSLSLNGHNQHNRLFGRKPLFTSVKRESHGLSSQWPLGNQMFSSYCAFLIQKLVHRRGKQRMDKTTHLVVARKSAKAALPLIVLM